MSEVLAKILIVEDEKPLARALEAKLKNQGYQVSLAPDGKTALELMTRERYDVALLDLMMPVMDGFQVLGAAQELSAAPVFIVLSNLTQPEDRKRCMKLGAREFFVKSETSLAAIVEAIKKL